MTYEEACSTIGSKGKLVSHLEAPPQTLGENGMEFKQYFYEGADDENVILSFALFHDSDWAPENKFIYIDSYWVKLSYKEAVNFYSGGN